MKAEGASGTPTEGWWFCWRGRRLHYRRGYASLCAPKESRAWKWPATYPADSQKCSKCVAKLAGK